MVSLRQTFFKGCLPQFLLDPFLNTLTHINDSFKEKNIILMAMIILENIFL